ncbi:MAG: hypothetical protein A3I06_09450 [Candidatus Lindowbacteria bacterium RIFCSPLOWO2_02_FULL_62_12]|nr:MAG: hypothetical protein A3I06_09450 [Candidatus Lindowbacteria bacterium RIFCSPLOWO2_02_FULL_62_12]
MKGDEMSGEAQFYTVFFLIAGAIAFVGTPFLIGSDYIESDEAKAMIALFYTFSVIGIGGCLLLGLGIHVLQSKLPISSAILAFLIKAAVAVVVVAIALCWFFAIIPLFAFVAGGIAGVKKANRR